MAIITDNNTSIAERQPFLKINNNFLLDSRTQKLGSALTTYLNLRTFSDSKAKPCFPAIKTLAKMQGCSPNTVTNHLNKLVKAGFIRIEHRLNQSNIYHFPLEQELLGKTEKFNISKEFPKAAMTTSKRRWEMKPPTPPEIFDTPPKNFAHPPQETCDLTRLTKPDLNNQNQKPISKTETLPVLPKPMPNTDTTVLVRMPFVIEKDSIGKPILHEISYETYYKRTIDYKKINQELLKLIDLPWKSAIEAALIKFWKAGKAYWFYPKAVLEHIYRSPKKMTNPGAFVNSAFTEEQKHYYLFEIAENDYGNCLAKWRHENSLLKTEYEYQLEKWNMENNTIPIRSLFEAYKQRLIDNNQTIESNPNFSREGKTFDTPKPRGMSNEEWCMLCGFEYDKWLAHKHAKEDAETQILVKKRQLEMISEK